MFSPRRSLRWPIILGVVMIVLVVAIIIGWVILNVLGALSDGERAGVYWAVLSVGTTFLVLVLVGVVLYLSLSIKAINLNRRQSNFIDSVTHELKSPIASLKLCLQTLSRRQLPAEEHANFVRFMLDDVDRLDQLVNHVLDAARLEHTPEPQPAERIELAELLTHLAQSVCQRQHVPAETIQLALAPVEVTAARSDLELVFGNLLDNAVKYGGSPPRVQVELRLTRDGWAVATVRDNGPGIPRKLRRSIFGRFVRLGSELERTRPGTGLGLYIVRTLVSRLKGRIRVFGPEPSAARSAAGESGTTFEVRFPHATPPAVSPPELPPSVSSTVDRADPADRAAGDEDASPHPPALSPSLKSLL